jgi:hypothetical protein
LVLQVMGGASMAKPTAVLLVNGEKACEATLLQPLKFQRQVIQRL